MIIRRLYQLKGLRLGLRHQWNASCTMANFMVSPQKPTATFGTLLSSEFPSYQKRHEVQEVKEYCKLINQLPHLILEEGCSIMANNFFPIKDNYRRIIPLLEAMLRNNELLAKRTFLAQSMLNSGVKASAELLYECLLLLIDFLDKANIGFLSGDIHPMTFNILERELDNNEDYEQLARNLRKYIFNIGKQYKLPLNGIKWPDDENQRNLFERQLLIEETSNEMAMDKFQQVFADLQRMSKAHNLFAAQKYIIDWFPKLLNLISEEQCQCLSNPAKEQQSYAQYLVGLQSEKLALIALSQLMRELIDAAIAYHQQRGSLSCYQIRISKISNSIGDEIIRQYIYEQEQKKMRQKSREQVEQLIQGNSEKEPLESEKELFYKQTMVRAGKQLKLQDEKLKDRLKDNRMYLSKVGQGFPKDIAVQIGSLLTYFLIDTIKFRNEQNLLTPILVQSYKIQKNSHDIAVLNVNQAFLNKLAEQLKKDNSMFIHLDRALPMVYPPSKWLDINIGGYYLKPTNLIRITDQRLQEEAASKANLQRLYDVIDNISSVPWRINSKVLNVVMQSWEQGGNIAEIPQRHSDKSFIYEHQIKEARTFEEKYKLLKKIQQQRDLYSLQCDFTLKLGVAVSFNQCSKIYFPHNLDFRGRLYPIPPHLNHMGADISRGLLEFSQGKPLGDKGLRWLKIHLANKMGKDKLSLDERVAYVDGNLVSIIKCADDPIGNREWADLEDAWQSLAAMFDFVSAIRSPNYQDYVSHLHIHQDGSCNGLQHYAALGRDIEGATQVNLADTKKPGDVYSHVAGMVERRVFEDSLNSDSPYHVIAIKLQNQIKRKIVKQTVMTSVYGVTFIGAREQIHRQLKDKGIIEDDDHQQYQASVYLAKITLDAIKDLFEGAHKIKQWLIKCATIISNLNEPVQWITPLGLPVIQPYRVANRYDEVKTVMSSVLIEKDTGNLQINKVKQRSAFPPNYIHSLDSTHLMYTSIECFKKGITFAAVHDSYWTHAGNVDELNELLREQFVRLHSQPLLEELKDSFERRYPGVEFPPIPERGGFDLENVKKSVYFFA